MKLNGERTGALRGRGLRLVLAAAVLVSTLAASPASVFAARLESDRVGGIRLSTGLVPTNEAPDVAGRSGTLVASTGVRLWSRRLDTRRRMASTTKVMTALLVLENCELDEMVRVPRVASHVGYAIGLRTGEHRSVRKLLELALVASSNDAATALAVHVGGSVDGFATMMNERAAHLGMDDTRYQNPHGLDESGHYSSARDLAKVLTAAMKHGEFRRILLLKSVWLPGYETRPGRRIKSTDKLLGDVAGLLGGKTGYTGDARYCFVASARRDGITLTCVILAAPTSSSRFDSAETLLEWGFDHYRSRRVCVSGQWAGTVPIREDPAKRITARAAETTSAPVLDLAGPLARRVTLAADVALPVFQGQRMGTVSFIQGSHVLARVPAVAARAQASIAETVGVVPLLGLQGRSVAVRTAESTTPVAAYDPARPVERTVELPDYVVPPVVSGQVVGAVSYTQDGRALVSVPVVAAESIDGPDLMDQARDWYRRVIRLVADS